MKKLVGCFIALCGCWMMVAPVFVWSASVWWLGGGLLTAMIGLFINMYDELGE